MGNWNINIQGVGCHHNSGNNLNDANLMADDFVARLMQAGHHIENASFTYGSKECIYNPNVLGLDFGGVISNQNTTTDLAPGIIEAMAILAPLFKYNIWIVSRVNDVDSRYRVFNYMTERKLWDQLHIPFGNIRFCLGREDKAPICKDLNISHFVDDHTEVLSHMTMVPYRYAFRTQASELLTHPPEKFGIQLFQNWNDIVQAILKDTL